MNKIKVFISYSQKDSGFARQLNASFFSNSIQTFLDTKDIRVGDSIPEKIYMGIGASTHLIYIMSVNSIASPWVKEEISIAKVREKQAKGFKILPVLLGEIELPVGLAHIRYADFRNWQNPYSYRNSFLLVLEALGIKPRLLANEDLIWYAKHSSEIQEHYRLYSEVCERIFGALDMIQDLGLFGGEPFQGKPYGELKIKFRPLQSALDDDNLLKKFKHFYEKILFEIDENDNSKLATLKKKIKELLNFTRKDLTYDSYRDYMKILKFRGLLREIVQMIQDIRNETEIILLAPIPTS